MLYTTQLAHLWTSLYSHSFSVEFSKAKSSMTFTLDIVYRGSVSLFNNPIQFQGPTHPQYTATIPFIFF